MLHKNSIIITLIFSISAFFHSSQAAQIPLEGEELHYGKNDIFAIEDFITGLIGSKGDDVRDMVNKSLLPYLSSAFKSKYRYPIPFVTRIILIPRTWGTLHDIRRETGTGAIKTLMSRPYKKPFSNTIKRMLAYKDIFPRMAAVTSGITTFIGLNAIALYSIYRFTSSKEYAKPSIQTIEIDPNLSFDEFMDQIEDYDTNQLTTTTEDITKTLVTGWILSTIYVSFYASEAAHGKLHQWLNTRYDRWEEILVCNTKDRTIESSFVIKTAGSKPRYCFNGDTNSVSIGSRVFTKNTTTGAFNELGHPSLESMPGMVELSYDVIKKTLNGYGSASKKKDNSQKKVELPICLNKNNTSAWNATKDSTLIALQIRFEENNDRWLIFDATNRHALPPSAQKKMCTTMRTKKYNKANEILPRSTFSNETEHRIWHQHMFEKLRVLCNVRKEQPALQRTTPPNKKWSWVARAACGVALGIVGYLHYITPYKAKA